MTLTPLGPTTLVNIIARSEGQTSVENVMMESFSKSTTELNQKVKKQVEQLREWSGLRPSSGILSCPDEILLKIVSKLPAKSLLALGATCMKLR